MDEIKKLYSDVYYGVTIDDYEFIGIQNCYGIMKDFALYTGIKHKHTITKKEINKGLESIIFK